MATMRNTESMQWDCADTKLLLLLNRCNRQQCIDNGHMKRDEGKSEGEWRRRSYTSPSSSEQCINGSLSARSLPKKEEKKRKRSIDDHLGGTRTISSAQKMTRMHTVKYEGKRETFTSKGLRLIELQIFKKEAIVQTDLLLTAAHSACTNSLDCNYLHSFFSRPFAVFT